MSTRKSTSKQNSETATKQSQDAGSETMEPPTTPTSRDSVQTLAAKRTRRTNSIYASPKRTPSDAAESPSNESSEKSAASKNSATKDKDKKDKSEPATKNPDADDESPGRRTRKVADKRPTMATRNSPTAKNSPVRTSLRAAAAKKNANSEKSPPKKRGPKRKVDAAAVVPDSTPIKRERTDSEKSEKNDQATEPATKRLQKEADEKEEIGEKTDEKKSAEEILTEIKIKTEPMEEDDEQEKLKVSITDTPSDEKPSDKDSKTDKESKAEDGEKPNTETLEPKTTSAKDSKKPNNTGKSSTTDTLDVKQTANLRRSRRMTIDTVVQTEKRVTRDSAKMDTSLTNKRTRKSTKASEEPKTKSPKETPAKKANSAKSQNEKEKSETSDANKEVETDKSELNPLTTDSSTINETKSEVSPNEEATASSSTEDCEKTDLEKKTDEVSSEPLTKSESEPEISKTPSVPESPDRTNSPSISSSPQVPESVVAPNDEPCSSASEQLLLETITTTVINGSSNTAESNNEKHEPLTIDTTMPNSDEKDSLASTMCTAGSEKSASLSPMDLQSEELSAVCVKEFSKEPEFLENNLGIEMDPKLGEIVQSAVGDKDEIKDEESIIATKEEERETATEVPKRPKRLSQSSRKSSDSGSSESRAAVKDEDEESELNGSDLLKEGEVLRLEDSTEEEKTEEESPVAGLDNSQPEDSSDGNTDLTAEIKQEEKIVTDEISCNPEHEEISENTQTPVTEDSSAINGKTVDKDTEQRPEDIIEHDEKEVEKRDTATPDEGCPMEIDSGVSDVAENNSNDPNEDLNLTQEMTEHEAPLKQDSEEHAAEKKEIVEPEEKKVDVIDSKEVDVKEPVQDTKENKENIQSLKLIIPKQDIPAVEKKEVAPMIIRRIPETPETLKQKEKHLKSLGLLTLKAADEAKHEKQRRRQLYGGASSKKHNGSSSNDSYDSGRSGNGTGQHSHEYTGTLKTVIKLNRPMSSTSAGRNQLFDSKKNKNNGHGGGTSSSTSSYNGGSSNNLALIPATGRHSLKMTFQKGRGRGGGSAGTGTGIYDRNASNGTLSHHSSEDTYYTIQNEGELSTQESVTAHGRKSHHYRSNTDQGAGSEAAGDKKEVVIPEKASSFGIHPGRLCQDQCYYCGGRFGLYDTPCHVAQIKSVERQRKILENEEKLTVDNCLCDACFRHVDRRANAAQKKRFSASGNMEGGVSGIDTLGGESTTHTGDGMDHDGATHHLSQKPVCFVTNCDQRATHMFRRKFMRKAICKLFGRQNDMASLGGRLPICDKHYETVSSCMDCALCKRRLVRNQMHHINQDVEILQNLLTQKGIPIKFEGNPAVCKLCKYFTNLLLKAPERKTSKAQFLKNYRKRLLQFHNVHESEDESDEAEEQDPSTKDPNTAPGPGKRGRKPKNLQTADNQDGVATTSRASSSIPASSEDGCSSNDIVDLESNDGNTGPVNASGQMQLDNDVMVDYDVPDLSDSPSPPSIGAQQTGGNQQQMPSKLQAILQGGNVTRENDDISVALRSNPNISMRELFPGEEEMGLQVNVPFGSSSSHRTPEGWTRVQTFLQYDEPTRRMWEDLQKPYGNQSSFLRHLILLEKYFRNGDLILSQSASNTAVAYSETVQNRLRSFDYRLPPSTTMVSRKSSTASSTASNNDNSQKQQQQQQQPPPQQQIQTSGSSSLVISSVASVANMAQNVASTSKDAEVLSKQLNSGKLTITVAPKSKLMPSVSSTQASTSQRLSMALSSATNTITTASSENSILKNNLLSRKNSAVEIIPIASRARTETITRPTTSFAPTKQQKLLAAANRLSTTTPLNQQQGRLLNLPPELISISRSNPSSLLLPGASKSINSLAAMRSKLHSTNPLLQRQQQHQQQHHSASSVRPLRMPPTIVKLPRTLTTHERLHSRNWRPNLIPMPLVPQQRDSGVLYETADGRKLPSMVQVQSGGRPFYISIHDYNRMCLLRMEKNMQDRMKNGAGGAGAPGPGGSGVRGVGGGGAVAGPSGSGVNANSNNANAANSLLKGALSSSAGGRPAGAGMMPQGKPW